MANEMNLTLLAVPPQPTSERQQEIYRARLKLLAETLSGPRDELRWKDGHGVIPPHVFHDAYVVPPAGQDAAYAAEVAEVATCRELGYLPRSAALLEVRAALEPGQRIVNVINGLVYRCT